MAEKKEKKRLDVLVFEQGFAQSREKAKNIIITPHTAWAPLATRLRLLDIVEDNIKAFLNGTPKNKVN